MKVATVFRFGSSYWMCKYVCVCKLHVFWCGKLCYSWKLKMCLCDDITNDILVHWFDRICTPFAFVFRCWITISFHTSGVSWDWERGWVWAFELGPYLCITLTTRTAKANIWERMNKRTNERPTDWRNNCAGSQEKYSEIIRLILSSTFEQFKYI